jgi:hypothetical protein
VGNPKEKMARRQTPPGVMADTIAVFGLWIIELNQNL